ncbi:MAG: ABC transporter ATP-binding protein [Clostridia bacterium]|nr:ABC transporter ATP-binding protein [Clostridia bacterium]
MKTFAEKLHATLYRFMYSFGLVWKSNPMILLCMILVAIVQGIVPVISSLISKQILNSLQLIVVSRAAGEVVTDFSESKVLFFIIFLFLFRTLNRLAGRLSAYTSRITGEQVAKTVKILIMEKSKEIDIAAYDTPEFYEKLENANREAGTRPVAILRDTFKMVSNAISLTSYLIILMSNVPIAALAIIAVTIPSTVINFVYRKKNVEYIKQNSKGRREMSYYANRVVNPAAAKEIRIFGLTDTLVVSFKTAFTNYYTGLKSLIIRENILQVIIMIVSVITNCACYIYIAKLVYDGVYLIGDFSLYTSAIITIANEITTLITTSATIYEGTLFIDNLIEFLNEKPKIVSPKDPVDPPVRGIGHSIEFKDVSFSYPGSDRVILSHINLKINPGDNVTLVGLNGAGKTTLIKLMTRLYDPTEGSILLDGKDLREYDTRDLYSIFGIIFQDFGRYAYSVRDNIRFGDVDRDMNDSSLESAA